MDEYFNIKIFIVAFSAFLLQLVLIYFFPGIGGDSAAYKTVAANLFDNKCISLSEPSSKLCLPHWGGNQLPGYPFFLALNYSLFGINDFAPKLTAVLITIISIIYLAKVLESCRCNTRVIFFITLALSFSPLHFAQARFLLTEQLTIGITILLLAEVLRSILIKEVKVHRLALAFTALFFIRYDSVTLILPIVFLLFVISPGMQGVRKIVLFSVLIAAPILAVSVRHINVGLTVIPEPRFIHDGSKNPNGYINWARSWIYETDHQEKIMFPLAYFNYGDIKINNNNNLSEKCLFKAKILITKLKKYEGKPFPEYLDNAFNELRFDADCSKNISEKINLNAKRVLTMWGTVTSSFGWPTTEAGLKDRLIKETKNAFNLKPQSFSNLYVLLTKNFAAISVRAFANIFWVVLLIVVLASTLSFRGDNKKFNTILAFTLLYMFTKTFFLIFIVGISFEIRLLYSLLPFMETISVLFLFRKFGEKIHINERTT